MAKVYIPAVPTRYDAVTKTRIPSLDLNQAEHFGQLVNLIQEPEGMSLEEKLDYLDDACEQITEDDYILAVGDLVLLAATMLFVHDRLGKVKLLRWDRKKQEYYSMEVEL